jgi:hypothetical protein
VNKQETMKILAVIKAAYPSSFRDLKAADANAVVELWAVSFAADSFEDVSRAVRHMIDTRTVGYSPTVAEVKEAIKDAKKLPEKNDAFDYDDAYEKLNKLRARLGMPPAKIGGA